MLRRSTCGELEAIDRQHALLYHEQPWLAGPDVASRLRELLENTSIAKN